MPWFAVETHLFVETDTTEQAAEIGQDIAANAARMRSRRGVIMAAFDARQPNDAEQEFIAACTAVSIETKTS